MDNLENLEEIETTKVYLLSQLETKEMDFDKTISKLRRIIKKNIDWNTLTIAQDFFIKFQDQN